MARKSAVELREVHTRLLDAFRRDPEPGTAASYRRAAEAVVGGLDFRTARRGFLTGWPGMRPIRQLLAEEMVLSRAALARDELARRIEAASALAQEDAVSARAAEGQAVRAVTSASTQALVALHAEKIHLYERKLAAMMQDETNPDSPKAKAARRAFRDIAAIVATLAEASERGQRALAKVLGEPSVILGGEVGIRPVTPVNADAATLAAEVEAATRALAELQAHEERSGANGAVGQ